ncbi:MAG: ribbon-helix-helix domain-containing protein [Methanobacteriaceae archaeon]|nr:ribbon-helix-helix domain-containing protein [Methanobacteriaceae archaeon]
MASVKQEGSVPKTVGTKVTPRESEEIDGLVKAGIYLSVSDFIREAVRDKLRATRVIKIRDVDYDEAKREVLGYYRSYSEAYDYEVADDLELDYEFVCQIADDLESEGRLGVVE